MKLNNLVFCFGLVENSGFSACRATLCHCDRVQSAYFLLSCMTTSTQTHTHTPSHPSSGDFYHLPGRGFHVFKTKALPTQRRELNTRHLPEQATKSWLWLRCGVRQICAPSSLQEGLFCWKGTAFLGISATKCATIDYMSECAFLKKKTISPLFKTLIKLARRHKRLLCGQL